MSVQSFKTDLLARYPGLFVRGPNDEDFECGPEELYIAAELRGDGSDVDNLGRQLFDYYAFEHDPHERRYVMGVLHEVRDLAEEHKVFIEWLNCASIGVYPN